MPLASGVVRVAEATGEARSPSASGENRAGSSGSEKPARRWCPWAEGRAPVSWDAPGDADARWRFGARLFSADFDGGNLARVERVTEVRPSVPNVRGVRSSADGSEANRSQARRLIGRATPMAERGGVA